MTGIRHAIEVLRNLTKENVDASGNISIIDLGFFDVLDVLDGPIEIYRPNFGQFLQLLPSAFGSIYTDIGTFGVGTNPANTYELLLTTSTITVNNNQALWVRPNTQPLQAAFYTNAQGYAILQPALAWQPNHVYEVTDYGIGDLIQAVGHYWANTGGTSGGSPPDFAGNLAGTVVDNDITWSDEGALPTQGRLHLFAMIAES